MKKSKILVLVASLLVAIMALTACGSVAIKDYINPDYDTSAKVLTTAEKISALKGYTYVEDNGYIAVFTMVDEETAKVTYKLVNLADASIITTLSKADTTFTFEAFGPTYLVAATTIEAPAEPAEPEAPAEPEEPAEPVVPDEEPAEPEEPEDEGEPEQPEEEEVVTVDADVTYTLYDVTGTAIATSKYESAATLIADGEYLLYDRVAYEIDVKGALTKLADVPEYISTDISLISEDYFYAFGYNTVVVYDHEFNYVSFYELPAYAVEQEFFLLDNGDYIMQYAIELDSEATKYDLYEVVDGATFKFDLVTLIVSAEDGSAKEIKMQDYVIEEVITNSELYDAEDDNNMYLEDSFENIVILYPIEEGQINRAESAAEMCLMSNKGKVGDSLKLYDDMFTDMVPKKLADNVYVTHGSTGVVLVDAKGEIIKRVTNINALSLVGNYFVGEYAIYSADLSEVVYDLKANEVDEVEIVGDSVFMTIKEKDEYRVLVFVDGETKAIYNSKTMAETKVYGFVDAIDGYYIYDIAAEQYTYYNAKTEKIMTSKSALTFVALGEETVIAAGMVEEDLTYYLFK